MRDGRTREKVESATRHSGFDDFAANWTATLVVLSGSQPGTDHVLCEKSTVVDAPLHEPGASDG